MPSQAINSRYERWKQDLASQGQTPPSDEEPMLYTPLDRDGKEYVEEIGFPGEFPFTRGVYPTMYRGRLWTMRQYAGFGAADETNARYRFLLEQGQTGLSVAFDLPSQTGYDSDHPMAEGEVGRVGVAIDSLADFERLLGDIPVDKISLSMTINATAPILLAMYIAVAEKQGVERAKLRGTVQNDILKEYVARGTYIYPPEPSLRVVADVIEFCSREMPKFNPISVSGYHMREAGATAPQEVAFTLADAIEYCQAALRRDLEIDDFAPRLSFFFSADNGLLEEVAKFRAARRLWARTVRDRYGARDPRSMQLRFHAQTAGSTLAARQPRNNIVRVALQALSAVLGGAQSLHTNSWDEAHGLPNEEAVRIALRTQQILAHESGVADTIDPLGGSYCVEALTDRIEAEAAGYMKAVEERGGMLAAIDQSYVQREIERAAYAYQQELEKKERVIVGSNRYVEEGETLMTLHEIDPRVGDRQLESLKRVKAKRDRAKVRRHLENIKRAAEANENLMSPIVSAVKEYATVGEISDVLREVFGTYRG